MQRQDVIVRTVAQIPAVDSFHQSALKVKEKLRINALKILHFDERDEIVVKESYHQVSQFIQGLSLNFGLTTNDILCALQDAHRASDEYYTMRHAQAWNTDFEIPTESIEADSALFKLCNYNFTEVCRRKQALLAHNRISKDRIIWPQRRTNPWSRCKRY